MKKLKNLILKDKITIILLFLFITSQLSSQIVIRGKITSNENFPIEYASVQLLYDSKCQNSALTDSLGNYKMSASKKDSCELVVNIIGYVPVHKKINLMEDTIINFVLQTDTTILNPITIVGKKKLINSEPDKLIVNIKGNIKTAGKQTTQILSKLPNITVSNNSLGMFGKSSVIVYINDHVVRLSGQSLIDYLNSLPPDIIESVEIITSPSAKYDAEGNIGIIRINTTKKILPGWKEYFTARYIKNTYSSGILSAYASYSGKKLFFEITINGGKYTYLNLANYKIYFPEETITTYNPKQYNIAGTKSKLTFNYDFNENNSLIVDALIPFFNQNDISDIENKTEFINPPTKKIDSTILSNGRTITQNYTYNSEIFFKHKFANQKSLITTSAAYLNNFTANERTFTSTTERNNINLINENFKTTGKQKYQIITSKVDFSFSVLNFNINAGGKIAFTSTGSTNNFFRIVNDNDLLDSSLSDKYTYEEKKQVVYFSIAKKIMNWSFKAGLRSEVTNTIGNSLTKKEAYKKNYTSFFPSLYVSNRLNDNNILSLSYAKRIERPPYQFLNPFRWYITKYDYSDGNPFLEPSFIDNFELRYLYGNTFVTKLYFSSQDDEIGKYVVLDSSNIELQVEKPDNFLNRRTYGLNLYKSLNIKKLKWLETVLQSDISYSEFISNRNEFDNISGLSGIFILNNTIFVKNKYQIVCKVQEKIPGLYDYRTIGNSFQLDIGLNYIITKKGLDIRLLFTDVFKTSESEYYYFSNGVKQVYKNYYDSQMLIVMFTWRPGNWYNKTLQLPSSSNAEEKGRL